MPPTKAADEVRLGTIPLKLVRDETGNVVYTEETVVGDDVLNEAAATQFVDVFTSWHKGGFMAEHVQDGFYNRAINVDCTTPGEIKPGPRRLATVDVGFNDAAAGAEAMENFYVCSLLYAPELTNYLLAVVVRENAAADNLPNRLTARWLLSDYSLPGGGSQGATLDPAAADWAAGTGFHGTPRLLVRTGSAGGAAAQQVYVPVGLNGYRCLTQAALGVLVAAPAHALIVTGGRGFRVLLSAATGQVQLSNIDERAVWATAGNWTTPVDLGVWEQVLTLSSVSLSLVDMQGVPYVGTHKGIIALGPGGFPFNLLPRGGSLREGLNAFWPFERSGPGIVTSIPGRVGLIWFNEDNLIPIGPGVNKLAFLEPYRVMDIHEAPNGNLWVYVWYPERAQADGVWEMWVGINEGDAQFSWHPVLRDVNANEGGPINFTPTGAVEAPLRQNIRPFAPVWWSDAANPTRQPEMVLATGGGPSGWAGTANAAVTTDNTSLTDTRVAWVTNQWVGFVVSCNGKNAIVTSNTATTVTHAGWSGGGNPGNGFAYEIMSTRARLTFVNAGPFFDLDAYEHEDGSGGYPVLVQWHGGRYSRHDSRANRHWTAITVIARNVTAGAGVGGGSITVAYRLNGGAFTALVTLSSDVDGVYHIPIDVLARDIELRLTWDLNGETGDTATSMRNAPAVVTQIQYEGREIPRVLRRISFVCHGTTPPQAGGVRQKREASNLVDTLEALTTTGLKQDFFDPFKPTTTRKVVVLPPQMLQAGKAPGMTVPEGAVRVTLLEVVG